MYTQSWCANYFVENGSVVNYGSFIIIVALNAGDNYWNVSATSRHESVTVTSFRGLIFERF